MPRNPGLVCRIPLGFEWKLESLSEGVRLKAEHMQSAVSEYGRALVFPPQEVFESIDVVPINGIGGGCNGERKPAVGVKSLAIDRGIVEY